MSKKNKRRTTAELIAELRLFNHHEAAERLAHLDRQVNPTFEVTPEQRAAREKVLEWLGDAGKVTPEEEQAIVDSWKS